MALLIATIVLWVAAISRVIVTIRRPDPARIAMTSAAVCVAGAFTLAVLSTGFDRFLGWPNAAELIQHILFAAAALLTLVFMRLLRAGTLPRRTAALHIVAFAVVLTAMLALFAVAPVHDRYSTNFAVDFSASAAAVLYRLAFYLYLVFCLVLIARTCLRHAFTSGDRARTISLLGIGAGTAAASIAAAASAIDMLVRYSSEADPGFLRSINTAAIAIAGILAGTGVLAPIPIDAFLRWRVARRTCQQLDPLWAGLTRAVPDVVLSVEDGQSALIRAAMASARRRIEIADALSRIRVNHCHAAAIQHSDDPPAALGQILRDRSAWAPFGSGVVAADLLRVKSSEDELEQILAVAGAYRAES